MCCSLVSLKPDFDYLLQAMDENAAGMTKQYSTREQACIGVKLWTSPDPGIQLRRVVAGAGNVMGANLQLMSVCMRAMQHPHLQA